jgi:hypothetical protein
VELKAFEALKNTFMHADTETKINLFVETEGLTQTQYKELLRMFPLNELNKLEAALA